MWLCGGWRRRRLGDSRLVRTFIERIEEKEVRGEGGEGVCAEGERGELKERIVF